MRIDLKLIKKPSIGIGIGGSGRCAAIHGVRNHGRTVRGRVLAVGARLTAWASAMVGLPDMKVCTALARTAERLWWAQGGGPHQ